MAKYKLELDKKKKEEEVVLVMEKLEPTNYPVVYDDEESYYNSWPTHSRNLH